MRHSRNFRTGSGDAVAADRTAPASRAATRGAAGCRILDLDGFEILVGKSARDNDHLTFKVARPRDVWLHAHGFAGSHVVIRHPDATGEVPRHVIERAAELAAWHSKARGARGKIAVHVCRAADVSKGRGAPAGQVFLRRFDTVKVYPREGADG